MVFWAQADVKTGIWTEEPYFGEVPELQGVWASGKTLEGCRNNLEEVIDEWIIIRLRKGGAIPAIRILILSGAAKNWKLIKGNI